MIEWVNNHLIELILVGMVLVFTLYSVLSYSSTQKIIMGKFKVNGLPTKCEHVTNAGSNATTTQRL